MAPRYTIRADFVPTPDHIFVLSNRLPNHDAVLRQFVTLNDPAMDEPPSEFWEALRKLILEYAGEDNLRLEHMSGRLTMEPELEDDEDPLNICSFASANTTVTRGKDLAVRSSLCMIFLNSTLH